jgi:hypothetical protein
MNSDLDPAGWSGEWRNGGGIIGDTQDAIGGTQVKLAHRILSSVT